MKKLNLTSALIFSLLFFAGCKKEGNQPTIIVEPQEWRQVARDSIGSGSAAGFTIGTTALETYQVVQQILQPHIPSVYVVSNSYHKMEDVAGKISLYNSIFFDEQKGTSTGMQISFKDNHVHSIYTNNGARLASWPSHYLSPMSVKTGMGVERVYPQLLALSSVSQYTSKFQRISLFDKNTNKDFDPAMAQSPKWYLAHPENNGQQRRIQLQFETGRLKAIVIGLYEPY